MLYLDTKKGKDMRNPKAYLMTLFIKQNKYHANGVLLHTLHVTYQAIKAKQYRMIVPALLHDIGKPAVAYQKPEDVINNEYSFTNHEEAGYQIIKNWFFINDYTKNMVRYHYLLRDMEKSKKKGNFARYRRLVRIFNKLPQDFKKDLGIFLKLDDLGKEKIWK